MHWRAYQDRYIAGIRASFADGAGTPLPRRIRRAEARLEGKAKIEPAPLRRCEGCARVPIETIICPESGTLLRDLESERRRRSSPRALTSDRWLRSVGSRP
jgi:hypothetical protein